MAGKMHGYVVSYGTPLFSPVHSFANEQKISRDRGVNMQFKKSEKEEAQRGRTNQQTLIT